MHRGRDPRRDARGPGTARRARRSGFALRSGVPRLDAVPSPLPPSSSAPFALPGSRAHALLIHGFSGTPYELRPVAEALQRRDIASSAVLLPGHGTEPLALGRVTVEEWKAAAEAAFRALPTDKPRVLVGASMGGLLALWLATRFARELRGVVVLAPALVFRPLGRVGLLLARAGLWRALPLLRKERPGGDISDAQARDLNPAYPAMAVHGIKELDRLRREVRALLPRVHVPVCAIHGARDDTIDPASSELVIARVRAPRVERHLLPHSRHVLGIDLERDVVASLTTRFIDDVIGGVS